MNIVVYLQKQEFRVTIDSRATLDELCAKLEKLTFIPPHYQKLRLDLNDDLIVLLAGTLQNSGVKDGATLYLEADEKFFMSLPPKLTDSINTTGTTQRNTSALPTIDEFEQYDCEQLCSWLSRMKLSEYTVKQCREEEVDGRALLGYTPKQLVDDLKLKSGASQSITNLLEKIRSQTTTPTTTAFVEIQKGGLRDGKYIKFESLKLGDMIGCGGEASIFVGAYCGEEYAVKRILKYKSTELDTILLFDHPCLMKCHYWTDDSVFYYYLMDQMETTLNDAIHGQLFPLSDQDKLKVMQDIARGCCVMHEKKVIHKDLKPSNILLRRNGSSGTIMAKISDFGISRAKRNESNISITYGLSGTIPYLPIEFLQSQESEHVYGYFTDVYAFGVILFEILFQEVPWKGVTTVDQIVGALLKGYTLLGKRTIPENWKGVGEIMMKCLGKREDRPTFQVIEKEMTSIVHVKVKDFLSSLSIKIIAELEFWTYIPLKCIEMHKKYPNNHIAILFCIGALYELKRASEGDELLAKISKVDDLGDLERGIVCYLSKQYRIALEQLVPLKHPLANCLVGRMSYFGFGTKVNFEEAVKWYRLAADQGYANAQCNLGFCYEKGNGVMKDEKEAVKWYRLAADQGWANAQCNLGFCYDNGTGVMKDEKEAVKWYRLAADQGDVNAQYNLGVCYGNGTGVIKNEKEAVKWYRLAADQGDVNAQYNLGLCYDNGTGVMKDEKEAVKWYRLAADQGYANAITALKRLNQ
jgi:TPR repeat protein/tRNA A-37 threonylcarbamoyl transferase component Bud32